MATTIFSYPLSNLEQGATYEFQVIAKGNNTTYDDSDPSSSVQWTMKTKLATPEVTCDSGTSSFTATWPKIANATSYTFEYKKSSDSSWTTATVPQPSSGDTVSKQISQLTSGSTYKVRVKAVSTNTSSYVESDYSTEVTVVIKTTLANPTPLWDSDTDSIWATWEPIPNATAYKVAYKLITGYYQYETIPQSSNPRCQYDGLESGSTYLAYVQSIGGGDYADGSLPQTTTVITKAKLSAPTNLRISARTTSSLTVSWDAVTNASGYNVYYKKGSGSYGSPVAKSSSETSHQLTGLNQGDTYTFYVIAVGSGKFVDSDASTTVTGKTKVDLDAPTGLAATNVLSTSATISWNPVAHADYYLLSISDSNGDITGYSSKQVTSTTENVTGLSEHKSYRVSLFAVSNSDDYSMSVAPTLTFTTDTKLGTPAAPTLKEKTINSLTVQWQAVSAADSYTLAYKESTESDFNDVPNLTKLEYELPSLAQGATYDFKVRAITNNDAYESGDFSPVASFTTLIKLDAPTGLNVTKIQLTEATLNWNDVEHNSGYILKYRKVGSSQWEQPIEVEG